MNSKWDDSSKGNFLSSFLVEMDVVLYLKGSKSEVWVGDESNEVLCWSLSKREESWAQFSSSIGADGSRAANQRFSEEVKPVQTLRETLFSFSVARCTFSYFRPLFLNNRIFAWHTLSMKIWNICRISEFKFFLSNCNVCFCFEKLWRNDLTKKMWRIDVVFHSRKICQIEERRFLMHFFHEFLYNWEIFLRKIGCIQ